MAFLLLLLASTLSEEASISLGKQGVRRHIESPYAMGFLGLVWSTIFFLLLVLLGGDARFSMDSLPTLLPRLVLEIVALQLGIKAFITGELSTISFLRLVTLPALLVIDVILGYGLMPAQIGGVILIFSALVVLFWRSSISKRGAGWAIGAALAAVGTVTLYKYNITHYNSVAVESLIALVVLTAYFLALSIFKGHDHPLRLLQTPAMEKQALSHGTATVLLNFSMSMAPASVVLAIKRVLTILWAIIFGRHYFYEGSTTRRSIALAMAGVGIVLIAF